MNVQIKWMKWHIIKQHSFLPNGFNIENINQVKAICFWFNGLWIDASGSIMAYFENL